MSEVDKICRELTLPFKPFEYQRAEIDRLVSESASRASYFWDMGAGKTAARPGPRARSRARGEHRPPGVRPR